MLPEVQGIRPYFSQKGIRQLEVANCDLKLPDICLWLQLAQLEKEVKGNTRDIDNIFAVLKELIEEQSTPAPRNKIGFKSYDKGAGKKRLIILRYTPTPAGYFPYIYTASFALKKLTFETY